MSILLELRTTAIHTRDPKLRAKLRAVADLMQTTFKVFAENPCDDTLREVQNCFSHARRLLWTAEEPDGGGGAGMEIPKDFELLAA